MQRRTACAAQHLHWSTNLGGIMGETGERQRASRSQQHGWRDEPLRSRTRMLALTAGRE
jgi:hypothetical protein